MNTVHKRAYTRGPAWFALFMIAIAVSSAAGRELQTVYSVGKYRTKNLRELGSAIRKTVTEVPAVETAWQGISGRAADALTRKPEIKRLDVELSLARQNNKVNVTTARDVFDLSLVYCAKGDKRCRDTAVKYFRTFVDKFDPHKQIAGIETNHQYHLLYAREWLPCLARSYDVLYDVLSPDERQALAEWLRDMTGMIASRQTWQHWKNTTHGTWQAAALGIVGSALGDADLLETARVRIQYQLDELIGREGMWPGGSLSFDFTATRAFFAYAEATIVTKSGAYNWRNALGEKYLRRLVEAPLMFIDPFGTIPGSNHMLTQPPPGDIYMIANQRYRDPLFAAIAQEQVEALDDETVLFYFRPDEHPVPVVAQPPYSVVSPTMGWAILRTGVSAPTDDLYARLEYGPHGGSSGHADKLAFYLCGFGRRVTSCGDDYPADSPMRFGWAKQTLAHNTVVINYRSQLGARTPTDPHGVPGKLLMFDRTQAISVVEADARNAYPYAPLLSYRRCIALADEYFLDIFTISAVKPITADWVFHGLGKEVALENAAPGERSLNNEIVKASLLGSKSQGYNWIDDVISYTANEQWSVTWSSGLRTIMMGQPGTRVLLGDSGGTATLTGELVTDRTYSQHTLIARRINTLDTRFVAVHEILTTNATRIESFARLETGTDALVLEVLTRDYKDVFILQPKRLAKEMMIDEHHLVKMAPRRYAYVRLSRKDDSVIHQVNLTVKKVE